MANDPAFSRLAISGFGLVGGSIAKAAARRWPAMEIVAIEADDSLAKAAGADLVILAAPVLANVARLAELPAHLAPGALVTDVGSTKRLIVAAANAIRRLTSESEMGELFKALAVGRGIEVPLVGFAHGDRRHTL